MYAMIRLSNSWAQLRPPRNSLTETELKNAIDRGDFDALIDLIEDEHLEAKGGKYDTSLEAGKQELAKDVSSFANGSGGIIVIGPKTSDDPAFYGRRISEVNLVPFDLINSSDYHNIIKAWIYPRPQGIDIKWISSNQQPGRGLFYVFVPNQPENLRPFLITKDIDLATNRKRKEILFGYAERVSHTSDPLDFHAVHTLIRLGRENRWREQLDGRLASIETKLSHSPNQEQSAGQLEEALSSRTAIALEAGGLEDLRSFSLAISPIQIADVRSFLSSGDESIARIIENPPSLRQYGWGVSTGNPARLISGELRRTMVEGYSVLDLYRDGTLVFACRADERLLGFNLGKTRINPVALVETTYQFLALYDLVLKDLTNQPTDLQLSIQFRHMHRAGLVATLSPYGVDSTYQSLPQFQRGAPGNDYQKQISIDAAHAKPAIAAFLALREIYAWFGIEEDKIPYLNQDSTAVDPETIKALH